MPGQRLMVLLGGVLVCFSGSSFAGPEKELPRDNQVWGDPEELEEAAEGWTWFGMGYENRVRLENRSESQTPDRQGQADGGGRGRSGKSGGN